jgi:hypothetical protein
MPLVAFLVRLGSVVDASRLAIHEGLTAVPAASSAAAASQRLGSISSLGVLACAFLCCRERSRSRHSLRCSIVLVGNLIRMEDAIEGFVASRRFGWQRV